MYECGNSIGPSLFATLQSIGILYFGRLELMSSFVRSFCIIQTSDPLIRNSQIEPVDGKLGFVAPRVEKPANRFLISPRHKGVIAPLSFFIATSHREVDLRT